MHMIIYITKKNFIPSRGTDLLISQMLDDKSVMLLSTCILFQRQISKDRFCRDAFQNHLNQGEDSAQIRSL